MFISKIRIDNYRNFAEGFEMPLNQFTVIIGENNVGKTNLISSIGLILSNDISFYRKRNLTIHDINVDRVNKFKDDILNFNIESKDVIFPEVSVEITLKGIEQNLDQLAVIADWVTVDDFTEASLTYIYFCRNLNRIDWVNTVRARLQDLDRIQGESDNDFRERQKLLVELPLDYYYYLIYGGRDITRTVDYYFLNLLKFEYLDGLRDAKQELSTKNNYKLLYKVLMSQDLDSLHEFKSELISFQEKLSNDKNLDSVRKNIVKYLDEFVPEGNSNNDVEFLFSDIEIQEMVKHLSLHFGDEKMSIDSNGLGYNNLLFISLVLSYLSVSKDDHTIFRLIAIEEPEAHLHPHLQKHLARSIKQEFDSGTQLIISTHSTHVSSSLDLDNTVALYKEGNVVSHHYILDGITPNAAGRKKERFLRKYLDATNSSLFYSRKVILVEGISEMLIIPELFRMKYGFTLEKAGCSIVNVNGLAFKNFIDLIKNGYFIKCLVLTDSDEGTRSENRAENLKASYVDVDNLIHIGVTSNTTFEKDLIDSNSTGIGRYILLSALKKTRPINWENAYNTVEKVIDCDTFFNEIEVKTESEVDGKIIIKKTGNYKSEFAYFLSSILSDKPGIDINIPEYIDLGFNFLMKENA